MLYYVLFSSVGPIVFPPLIINSSRGPKIGSAIVIGLSTNLFPSFLFKVQEVAIIMNEMQLSKGL